MKTSDLELYLPKFLSDGSKYALKEAIKKFPKIVPKEFYSENIPYENLIFQGDGIKDLIFNVV